MLLADMGADVLLVDRAQEPGPGSIGERRHDVLLRGRRSVTLDLKSPTASRRRSRSPTGPTSLIEGFRPGVMERLGLGPDVAAGRAIRSSSTAA